jgi:hypothetical protein
MWTSSSAGYILDIRRIDALTTYSLGSGHASPGIGGGNIRLCCVVSTGAAETDSSAFTNLQQDMTSPSPIALSRVLPHSCRW